MDATNVPVRSAVLTPLTTNGGHDEAVGRRIGDFFTRIVHGRDVRVAYIVIERLDDCRRIGFGFRSVVVLRLIGHYESAVVRIACHGAKDHPQVAGAARTAGHQVQRLAKTGEQIVNLLGVAAKPVLLSGAWIIIRHDNIIINDNWTQVRIWHVPH